MVVRQGGTQSDFQVRLANLSDSFSLLSNRLLTAPSVTLATPSANTAGGPIINNSCPESCVSLINTSAKAITQTVTSPVISSPASNKGEYSVFLGSGAVSQTNNWTDITSTQVTLDTGNFGSIKQAYFEVTLHATSGEVHSRLFDATTPAIIWGSEVKSVSSTGEYLSVPITLTSGSKAYRVQMYSTISTGFLDSARIRIVTQ